MMYIQYHYLWLFLVAISLGIEILTGTIYLLIITPGFIVGGILSYFNFTLISQITIVSLTNILNLIILQTNKKRFKINLYNNRANNLDINHVIYINNNWQNNDIIRATYRGSSWKVLLQENTTTPKINGSYKIINIKNNHLIVKKINYNMKT